MAETSLSYDDIQRALTQSHSLADAAEAHGTLSGALCSAPRYTHDDWLGEILPDGRAAAEAGAWLRALFDSTTQALGGEEMAFQPLLPDDDGALTQRTDALGEWCRGFLYGLGSGPLNDLKALGEEADELLGDFTAITQVAVDPAESDEHNEEAYAELVEFVRVGVQLIFDRLEPLREPPPASDGSALH